ncbi:flagellar protein FliT [Chromobacterium alticapitis]|uniref:flagellar protein FliT n=1 Tax=Chromobacterium alticapitis TaxID=2073169 RepID=UPI001304E91D|nr:flagellar protein FliT [Chromobacterium alticapitis]
MELADLIRELESAVGPLRQAACDRESSRFYELLTSNEERTGLLLRRLEAEGRDQLSPEHRSALRRVLASREEIQQLVAEWAEHVKDELKALSHSAKLNRRYKG